MTNVNRNKNHFTQGGQYNSFNNYNFGFYTGDNGGGDYLNVNVGKNSFNKT